MKFDKNQYDFNFMAYIVLYTKTIPNVKNSI